MTARLAEYYPDNPPNPDVPVQPVKIDRKLTFDRLTNVHYSGTKHAEDQPPHLIVHDTDICRTRCRVEYGNPCHAILSGQRLRDGRCWRRNEAPADQRFELRALQDVRHHGSVSDHQLGDARRRRRTELRGNVDDCVSPSSVATNRHAARQGRKRSRSSPRRSSPRWAVR